MPRWIIGLASGSSADEVDAALLEVEGVGLELRPRLVGSLHQPYGPDLKDLIRRVSSSAPCEIREVSSAASFARRELRRRRPRRRRSGQP